MMNPGGAVMFSTFDLDTGVATAEVRSIVSSMLCALVFSRQVITLRRLNWYMSCANLVVLQCAKILKSLCSLACLLRVQCCTFDTHEKLQRQVLCSAPSLLLCTPS